VTTRRAFLWGLTLGTLVATAQATKIPRIGWLSGPARFGLSEFKQRLGELGYIVGQSVLMDIRSPKSDEFPEYPDLAAQLIATGVDVMLAANPLSLAALSAATKTIPIIGVDLESDPVTKGWAASLAHPGRNITGFFLDIPEMSGKQLQFLKEVKPNLSQVAILGDSQVNQLQFEATEIAARNSGLTLHPLAVKSQADIASAIAGAARKGARALVALTSPLVNIGLKRVAEAAVAHRLPSICGFVPIFAQAGGLLAYGPDFPDLFHRAAGYVAMILKGSNPDELPIQRPTKFDLVINLKTAKALGLTIPQSVLVRADEVIQ